MRRCVACHTPLAGFGKRARAHVEVCDFCMRIARHNPDAIRRFRKTENATDFDVSYVRMRVRSAVYYAWMKRHKFLAGIVVRRIA